MADIALDADGLRRDRRRYFGLLEQAEQQIAAWNERADHLQQAIDGLDHLLALSGDDPAQDGGVPRGAVPGRGVAPSSHEPPVSPPPAPKAAAEKPPEKASKNPAGRPRAAKKPPAPTATPAAPEPVEPPAAPAAEVPRGTDALRLVFESDAERAWSLGDLIEALGDRGWLPTSRRPEEGVRISLKRLAERGRVERTDDGQWRLADPVASTSETPWPAAEAPPAPTAPAPDQPAPSTPAAAPRRATGSPLPTPFGRPVGGTVTEL